MRFSLVFLMVLAFSVFADEVKKYNQMVDKYNKQVQDIRNNPAYKEFFDKDVMNKKVNEGKSMIDDKAVNQRINEVNDRLRKEYGSLPEDFKKYRDEADMQQGWDSIGSYRYYLFISSSIPESTLLNYVSSIYEYNRKNTNSKVVMVLRGCVGGSCEKLMPTINWIKGLLTYKGKYEKGLPGVEIWIDPTFFRAYKIDKVPCLSSKDSKKVVCGDWSLDYLISSLNSSK